MNLGRIERSPFLVETQKNRVKPVGFPNYYLELLFVRACTLPTESCPTARDITVNLPYNVKKVIVSIKRN